MTALVNAFTRQSTAGALFGVALAQAMGLAVTPLNLAIMGLVFFAVSAVE